jgi:hypothetical protein
MADSIITQFRREYNSPIETDRQVNTIGDRDLINTSRRWQGMIVYVVTEDTSYTLGPTLDNTAWNPIAGIPEAPDDGQEYIRKDKAWFLLPASSGVEILSTIDASSSTVGNTTEIKPLGNMVIPANTLGPGTILEGRVVGLCTRVSGTPILKIYVLDNLLLTMNLTSWTGSGGFCFNFTVQVNSAGDELTISADSEIIIYQSGINANRLAAVNLNQAKNIYLSWQAQASETLNIYSGYIKKL